MFQSCIHTAEHFWKGKYITDTFFSLIHRKYNLQGSFYMTASTLHKHTHTHTESKGEFNHFTARISLLRNPLTFPLSALHSLSSPPRKPTPTQTPPHTPDNHPHTYRRWGFGRACLCCRLRSPLQCGPSPGPHSRSRVSDPPEPH